MDGISPKLRCSLHAMGFKELTEIQKAVFEPALAGEDLVARAPTGTGKTAAFLIPIIQRMLEDKELRALVIEPSRELAIQAANECRKIVPENALLVVAAYGGTNPARQGELVKKGARIVIGTPGRVHEMLQQGVLKPSLFSILVLDEADRLMQGEFLAATMHIASRLPKTRQTMLFSVQMPAEEFGHAGKLLGDFKEIKTGTVAGETIEHYYVVSKDKPKDLAGLVRKSPGKSIVFCSTAESAEEVRKSLKYFGVEPLTTLHSQMDSQKRHAAIKRFAQGDVLVLVATDLAARGMQFDGVKRVYSFDIPAKEEFYVHRAGRTGRMGAKGECISIVSPEEVKALKAIHSHAGARAAELSSP